LYVFNISIDMRFNMNILCILYIFDLN